MYMNVGCLSVACSAHATQPARRTYIHTYCIYSLYLLAYVSFGAVGHVTYVGTRGGARSGQASDGGMLRTLPLMYPSGGSLLYCMRGDYISG